MQRPYKRTCRHPVQHCGRGLVFLSMQSLGELFSEILRLGECGGFVSFPMFGSLVVQRVIRVGRSQQTLDGEQHRADLQGR